MANSVDRSTSNPLISIVPTASIVPFQDYASRPVEFIALGDAAARVLASLKTKVQASNRT